MKKILSFFLLFSFLFATRYDISIQKMREVNFFTNDNYIISKKVILSNATHNYLTKHFTIYWGDKNPATTLWADYNKDNIPDFITNTASILEHVWDKEINQFGFNSPEFDHINVYISDTGLYINGKELTLEDNICGYAVYSTDEEYIIINATPPVSYGTSSMEMLKITLAHEFFHLVQYGYSLNFTKINTWLYEGTAVLMEHLVYPDITDYVTSYVYQIFNYPNIGFMNYNGLFPYASVIFFDYLENKYGINFIKKIWETFDTQNNALYAVNKTLGEYDSNINKEIYNFYFNLEHNLSSFSNSKLLSQYSIQKNEVNCDNNLSSIVLPTGALFVNSSCKQVSFINYDYNNTTFSSDKDAFAYNTDDFVVSFAKNLNLDKLYYDTVYYTSKKQTINLNKGWNLVTFKKDENLTNYEFDILWVYRDNKWYGYSSDSTIKNYLIDNKMFTNIVYSNDGVWIYIDKDKNLEVSVKKGEISYNFKNGWNLVSFPSYMDLNVSTFSNAYDISQIWSYEKNIWKFYSKNSDLIKIAKDNNISTITNINTNGFWIVK